jgi:hypothetical protein
MGLNELMDSIMKEQEQLKSNLKNETDKLNQKRAIIDKF